MSGVWPHPVAAYDAALPLSALSLDDLLGVARGVEDWAADAALNALVTAAWTDPGSRDEIAGIVGARFADAMHARRQREVTIAISLAHLVLITPGMPSGPTSRAVTVIKALPPSRR